MNKILFSILLCILSVQISNAQWVQVNNGMCVGNTYVWSLAANGNNIFAGTYLCGIYLSTNNGSNWTQSGLTNRIIPALIISGNDVYAGTGSSYGVQKSTNNGTSWTQTSLNNQTIYSFAVNGNNIFAGTYLSGVFLSTNNGTNWTQTSLNNKTVRSLAVSGNNIFAGIGETSSDGVYLSTNNGSSWTQTSLNNQAVYSLAINGNNIFAGTFNPNNGVYLSTNNGTTWTQTSLNSQGVDVLTVNGNNVFAGTTGLGVYVSTDNGVSWTQRNEGLGNLSVYSFCIVNNYIFAGTTTSVYRRPLSEFTGIQPISNEIPNQFSLSQNYPNPFNPTTKIRFALPVSSFAKLVVYDALGRELETLVSEQLNAGTYEADWNAGKFSSGVYYYKITAGNFVETKKMVLIK